MKQRSGLGRVAIYYRVSTDKQELGSQRQVVEKWVSEQKSPPTSVAVYQDEGITGSTVKRPSFQQMLEDCYSKKIDTVICYRLDRFSRNATTAIRLLLHLDEVGVAFISVTQPVLNLGHENPFRRTMLAAFAEIAEIERDTIVLRVKAGLENAKKKGVKLGPPTKLDTEVQQKIQALRLEGRSMAQIAKEVGLSVGSIHKVLKPREETPSV